MHQYSKFELDPYVNRYVWIETNESNRLQAYVKSVDDPFVELVIIEEHHRPLVGSLIVHRTIDHRINRGSRTIDHRITHRITGHRIISKDHIYHFCYHWLHSQPLDYYFNQKGQSSLALAFD
jgi:hypothetical protein